MPQLDLTLQPVPVMNAAADPPAQTTPNKGGKPRAANVKPQGTRYVTISGATFKDPKYTVDTMKEYSRNYYGGALTQKLQNILFTGDIRISVKDADGNEDPELTQQLKEMAVKAGLWNEIRSMFRDVAWYGPYFISPGWAWIDNVYTLTDLVRLPPETFDTAPIGAQYTYNDLLPGITLGPDGKPQYWQTTEENPTPTLINNIVCITNPDSKILGGEPIFRSLIVIFAYLKFAWESVIKTINRAGSPVLFIKVNNGTEDDYNYAKTILENWGANTAFQLKESMDLVNPGISEPQTPMEAIETLARMVIDFWSPASFVQNPSATLSSSDTSAGALMDAFIRGMHTWMEDGIEQLLRPYIRDNGYEDLGYSIEASLAMPESDRSDTLLQVVGNQNITAKLQPKECREIIKKILGPASNIVQDLTDEQITAMEEKIKAEKQANNPFAAVQGSFVQNAVRFYGNAADKKKSSILMK